MKFKFGLVEERGILKCVGQLQNSDLNIEAQRPIILPRNHRLTNLIILECHASWRRKSNTDRTKVQVLGAKGKGDCQKI